MKIDLIIIIYIFGWVMVIFGEDIFTKVSGVIVQLIMGLSWFFEEDEIDKSKNH